MTTDQNHQRKYEKSGADSWEPVFYPLCGLSRRIIPKLEAEMAQLSLHYWGICFLLQWKTTLHCRERGLNSSQISCHLLFMTVILGSRSETPEEISKDAGLGALPGHVWGGAGLLVWDVVMQRDKGVRVAMCSWNLPKLFDIPMDDLTWA